MLPNRDAVIAARLGQEGLLGVLAWACGAEGLGLRAVEGLGFRKLRNL